ncbi:peptide deformylase [Shewanella cyperi]|uniref:peptide deformylase n=1 Tax=Shewanella cyperi TaxID=2814292 RepID=UPI001A94867C|nr:peptide deformylase [Shewanella cyperi]QSX41431.1 peptide deformylase [Shewanella cyperi]
MPETAPTRPASDVAAIIQVGDPLLTRAALKVTRFDEGLKSLALTLLATMEQACGVGIAAPQIAESLALCIVASRPNIRYPDAPAMEPMVMANPEILARSNEMHWGEEGCLSVPERRQQIRRHLWVDARWQDLDGNWQQQRLSGFIARVFQHELDHLHGITLLERCTMADQRDATIQQEDGLQ